MYRFEYVQTDAQCKLSRFTLLTLRLHSLHLSALSTAQPAESWREFALIYLSRSRAPSRNNTTTQEKNTMPQIRKSGAPRAFPIPQELFSQEDDTLGTDSQMEQRRKELQQSLRTREEEETGDEENARDTDTGGGASSTAQTSRVLARAKERRESRSGSPT